MSPPTEATSNRRIHSSAGSTTRNLPANGADDPEQVRRRRAASYRSPVLADGRRDPLDKPLPGRSVQVRAIGRRTVEFVGCDRAVYAAITSLCARYQRAPKGGAWLIRDDFAEDVLALLESRGYTVEVTL